jgi:hypothetical protein
LTVGVAFAAPVLRRRLVSVVPWLTAGAVAGVGLASPVIVAALRSGIPESAFNPPELYPTELTNVVAPTGLTLIGSGPFAELRTAWIGNDAENTAYLPVTLLLVAAVVVVLRRTRVTGALAVFAAVAFLFSLGPFLTIAGVPTVRMPWALATEIPGLDHALPARFSAFVFMAVVLLVAQAWGSRALPRWSVVGISLVSCLLLLPNLTAMTFPVDARIPAFVTDGELDAELDDGENVLVLPAGQWGPGMRWMDELDFSFTMPSGNGGGAQPPPALQDPLGAALFAQNLDFPYEKELLPYLDEVDVDTVIVDERHREWKDVMDRVLPGEAEEEDGAWLYRVP